MVNNFNIEKFLDLSTYVTDERKERRKNRHNTSIKDTNEFFTPYSIIKRMCGGFLFLYIIDYEE